MQLSTIFPYPNQNILDLPGYEVHFTRFADAILDMHFTEAREQLEAILTGFYVREQDVVKGGGGRSLITKDLGGMLIKEKWKKHRIKSTLHVGEDKVFPTRSHEIDHYRSFPWGGIGLEIEWNNKDPFFDRDLDNFRKSHQIGEQALGVIITRGKSLQTELEFVIQRFLNALDPFDLKTISSTMKPSDDAKKKIGELIQQHGRAASNKVAKAIYASKFGTSTTHMSKLLEHVERGAGDPCPLILIGIGRERLIP
jgi:hypothetical protein